MLARIATFAIDGVDPRQVWVEVDIRSRAARVHDRRPRRHRGAGVARPDPLGDPQLRASSSPDAGSPPTSRPHSCVRSAPASTRRSRSAVLAASGQVPADCAGGLRRVRRAVARRRAARLAGRAGRGRGRARAPGCTRLIVPRERAGRRRWSTGWRSPACRACAPRPTWSRAPAPPALPRRAGRHRAAAPAEPDLADVRGHAAPLLALADRRRRRPQPAARGRARHRQDDAGSPAALDPAAR